MPTEYLGVSTLAGGKRAPLATEAAVAKATKSSAALVAVSAAVRIALHRFIVGSNDSATGYRHRSLVSRPIRHRDFFLGASGGRRRVVWPPPPPWWLRTENTSLVPP